jgi:hypothetical protein
MRSVTRILLGTAAGFVAVAGAQAADLPIKAKPVEYVKVCSLYGAGFWYVPGTDTCIKIGAFVKLDVEYNADGTGAVQGGAGGQTVNFGGAFTRLTGSTTFRNRAAISFDMRSATDYGTLRSYMNVGTNISTGTGSVSGSNFTPLGPPPNFGTQAIYADRAFLQFAGFTAGRMRSFFDMVHIGVYSILGARVSGDTSPNGITGIAYTWQFGGGLSASVSLEDGGYATGGRGRSTVNLAGGSVPPGPSDVTSAFGIGTMMPDIKGQTFFDPVFNIRLDQAWGFVGASLALHDNSGGYYGSAYNCAATSNPATSGLVGLTPGVLCGAQNVTTNSSPPVTAGTPTAASQGVLNGHPADSYGWAGALGFTIANPFGLQGDSVGAMGVYSVGAIGYNTSQWGPTAIFGSGNKVGMSYLVDGIYNTGTSVEMTKTWSFQAFYEHLWNSKWRTSIYGGMLGTNFDANAKAMICPGGPGGSPNPVGFTGGNNGVFSNTLSGPAINNQNGAVTNCNPDSSIAQLGTRTMWNPVPDLDVGFDVSWFHLNTAFAGTANINPMGSVFQPAAVGRNGGPFNITNQDVVSAYFRVQRNFLY